MNIVSLYCHASYVKIGELDIINTLNILLLIILYGDRKTAYVPLSTYVA